MSGEAIPVGDGFVVLGGFVGAAVLEGDAGVSAEGEEVGQEEAISGFDLVEVRFGVLGTFRADGVPGEREGHVEAAPVVSAAAPFFGAGALGLGGQGVVEVEARVAFKSAEIGV